MFRPYFEVNKVLPVCQFGFRKQWRTLGDRKSNDSIVNLSKCKDFASTPPVRKSVYEFGPPVGKYHINLQATKLFIVTSATKGGGYHPLDSVLGSRYCIV